MGLSTSSLRTAAAVSLGASALLLTACSNPVGATAGGDAASAQNSAPSDASVSNATAPEAVTLPLPADFPKDVHLISGDIMTASGSKDAWQVVVAGQGTQAEFQQAKQKLESAGFSEVFFNDDNAVYTGEYSNGNHTVQLIVGAPDFKGTAYFVTKIS